ncbi:MAG: TIR domain-containing protein [Alphaproteobacteria bacterium]|nr:TIR domain-containing protein [Alphaproteobacteria bacterium]
MSFSSDQRKLAFVSYDREHDEMYFDILQELLSNHYTFRANRSIQDATKQNNPDYVTEEIFEKHVAWPPVTIVLCGSESFKKKWMDWEICATLERKHALLGITLPNATKTKNGKVIIPERLMDNMRTRYSHCISWANNSNYLHKHINVALEKSKNSFLIKNIRHKMSKDLPSTHKKQKIKKFFFSP